MIRTRTFLIALAALGVVGCAVDTSATLPGAPDSSADTSTGDAGDASPPDSGPIVRTDDSGMTADAAIDGTVDSAAAMDATADSSVADTSVMDSAATDSSVADTSVVDSAAADTSVTDAGTDTGPLAPCRDRPAECVGLFGGFCDAARACADGEGVCCTVSRCGQNGTCTQTCSAVSPCPVGMGCEHGFCFFNCSPDGLCFSTMTCGHSNTVCEWR